MLKPYGHGLTSPLPAQGKAMPENQNVWAGKCGTLDAGVLSATSPPNHTSLAQSRLRLVEQRV
jgi:hypothetical protein